MPGSGKGLDRVKPIVEVEFPGRGFSKRHPHLAPPTYKLHWPDGGFCIWDGSRWMVLFGDGKMVEAQPEQANLYDTIVGRNK